MAETSEAGLFMCNKQLNAEHTGNPDKFKNIVYYYQLIPSGDVFQTELAKELVLQHIASCDSLQSTNPALADQILEEGPIFATKDQIELINSRELNDKKDITQRMVRDCMYSTCRTGIGYKCNGLCGARDCFDRKF